MMVTWCTRKRTLRRRIGSPVRLVALTLASLCAIGLAAPTASATGAPGAAVAQTQTDQRPVQPIDSLDLERYQGRWLQLAAIPSFFSAPCARDTRAQYAILPDGLVEVINTCTSADGSTVPIEGRAQVTGPDSNAQLEVSFAPDGSGGFAFTGEANYLVIGIDRHEYSWAVVGNADRTSGFVLSRVPRLDGREVLQVLTVLLANGYDPCAFDITATTGGVQENRLLCQI